LVHGFTRSSVVPINFSCNNSPNVRSDWTYKGIKYGWPTDHPNNK
jgi:hypothetical protein